MLKEVGDLYAKGFTFFLDENFTHEIKQNTFTNIDYGESIDLYIGLKYRTENDYRYGKIISLEENFPAIMVDMIKEDQDQVFRNYDNIDSIEFSTTFDARGFLKNLLISQMNWQYWQIIEFIQKQHMAGGKVTDIFKTCINQYNRTLVSCSDENGDTLSVFPPDNISSTVTYDFYTDYFYEAGDTRVSWYEQWRSNFDVNRAYSISYAQHGSSGYNFVNDVYPEQPSIMNSRWKYGGYDVEWQEYNVNQTFVYNTFMSWYGGHGGNISPFVADEKTVVTLTDIAKTSTRYIFERDEHILIDFLGPRECISRDEQGHCSGYGYGTASYGNIEEPPGELGENDFQVIYNSTFEGHSNAYVQGSAYDPLTHHSINGVDAFYAVEAFNGKIGGQYVYKNGMGNEYRYFMSFRSFLEEQGWTLDDFMNIYSSDINARIAELTEAVTNTASIKNSDFTEFYDKNHKAPFDGINYYVPLIPSLDNQGINISKRRVDIDEYGHESFVDLPVEILPSGSMVTGINKDEFVAHVSVPSAIRVFISNYMKIKMTIKFKSTFFTARQVKLRLSTSDFTYLKEREFRYYA